MPVISVRLSDPEATMIRSYCELHRISLSDALKSALLEKIGDELDNSRFDIAKAMADVSPEEYTLEQVRKELNL